ncbi:hypothetical protein EFP84_04515 [Leptospira kmetyi]|uniref:Uncharacterized protein n=1 Tax=Leptospira kmetyi TaxID=408139 RepID=A0AAD0XNM5_9LEPT|nr:hypothetical protein [Leptospira kmetyi]AYV54850.1 hypothetical protein EFP84_04515 [Leptospira kmetyi]TGL68587.1 hypothetical protein EHQ67_10950 [Leptospira kmetyi]
MKNKSILLLFFLFASCSFFRVNIREYSLYEKECKKQIYFLRDVCEDEFESLSLADHYLKNVDKRSIEQLDTNILLNLAKKYGVDFALSYYYQSLISDVKSEEIHSFVSKFGKNDSAKNSQIVTTSTNIKVIHVPGMFYKNSGQDNHLLGLAHIITSIGLKFDYVPVDETGTIQENGEMICSYISKEAPDLSIILVSTSKGGADVKTAIQKCGQEKYFKRVLGWFNIGGINKGTPIVNTVNQSWRKTSETRIAFFFKQFNWSGFQSIKRDPGSPLFADIEIPESMIVINIIGLPMDRYVSLRAYEYYQSLLSSYGPNEGLALIGDSYMKGAYNFGAWRNDHYFWLMRDKASLEVFIHFMLAKIEKNKRQK